jgi:hypothetical protein
VKLHRISELLAARLCWLAWSSCMCAACVLHAGSALAARACRHRVIRLVCSAGWLAHLPAPLVQVAEGSDADVIIFDPSAEHTLGAATHHSAMDTNIYEGPGDRQGERVGAERRGCQPMCWCVAAPQLLPDSCVCFQHR